MARKDDRLHVAPLGEYYDDILKVDSWINARPISSQANSLLCVKLQEREERIRARIEYLAAKRGISGKELWNQILKGDAKKLEPEEITEVSE
ncbi:MULTISPECIES: hypothetical protein [unclassified Microcoleus]|uniref:hypothetical protein n=1 Tax=unclassified Microcoleus TaxID=2642155 RepID=UPI002FD5994D